MGRLPTDDEGRRDGGFFKKLQGGSHAMSTKVKVYAPSYIEQRSRVLAKRIVALLLDLSFLSQGQAQALAAA